jgi:hypothetical protein
LFGLKKGMDFLPTTAVVPLKGAELPLTGVVGFWAGGEAEVTMGGEAGDL